MTRSPRAGWPFAARRTPTSARSTADLICTYAAGFNAQFGQAHGVSSPLGAWLLLALVAPVAANPTRRRLEALLGTDATDAAARAGHLLADPHPAVATAVATWARAEHLLPAHDAWRKRLPEQVERGPVPDQAGADAWAERVTDGLISTFPVAVEPSTLLVLASALAARVPWARELDVVPATHLGGEFGDRVERALVSSGSSRQFLAETEAAGLVAAHTPDSGSGVRVLSVIAAPEVSPARVHQAAHEVAALLTGQDTTANRVSLFDLPLGDGHAWTLTEQTARRVGAGTGRVETVDSILPAWAATSNWDVLDAPGILDAVEALSEFVPQHHRPLGVEARQSAMAEYTQTGFTAAAVTAISMRAGCVPLVSEVLERSATVRFNRPHAVLAVTDARTDAWSGVPLFSAWVGQPAEVAP